MAMKITFIGSGSAFTVGEGNYNSNILLEADNSKKLLIDCGSDARHALNELGLSDSDIDNVFISHLHADHSGGLEWLGFSRKFISKSPKPHLYISEPLNNRLWDHTLSGGMSSLDDEKASLESFFVPHLLKENAEFDWEGINFKTVRTKHVNDAGCSIPSYGLFLQHEQRKIYITSDTQFTPEKLEPYYRGADVIFHDCETGDFKSGVHAHFDDLVTLDSDIKSKMWLYHYSPGALPDAKSAGFKGFVKKGQSFEFRHTAAI